MPQIGRRRIKNPPKYRREVFETPLVSKAILTGVPITGDGE